MLFGFPSRPQAIALFIHLEQRCLKGRLEADYDSFLAITLCTFPKKRYHALLFLSDRRTFQSTDCCLLMP
ncbi:hypothetical protein [Nostoc sp. CHAB 5715]|uniref:hypothetical protein n=1 Tax=Nostoc sp. CHAB 5715 TaxID=2780400 RepID=UPI001E3CCBE5|nr:hypothetical protein [Nostoc sp. CHAB 5715]MCC5624453.1 hypothetical protein [Nostoc sp. CHAB 5715]